MELKFRITKKKETYVYENMREFFQDNGISICNGHNESALVAVCLDMAGDFRLFDIPYRYENSSDGHFFYIDSTWRKSMDGICAGNGTDYELIG